MILIDDSDEVQVLIKKLNLKEYVTSARCFTYQNDKFRLVFWKESLNEDEKNIVLAHEEGHIWNGHLGTGYVLGQDVVQEYQANEFCHFLLQDKTGKNKSK